MKKIVKDALVLFAITLVAGILLGVVYQITLDPIAKANENAKEKAYKAVLSEADSFETVDALPSDEDINASSDIDFSKDKVNEVAVGKKGGETAGYVVTVTDSDGYGGDIKFYSWYLNRWKGTWCIIPFNQRNCRSWYES
mgnify:CR=1 FL=1